MPAFIFVSYSIVFQVITKKSADSDYMFMVKSGWCSLLAKIEFTTNQPKTHSSTTIEVSDAG